jgi:DNA-binding response OmpR family regulator
MDKILLVTRDRGIAGMLEQLLPWDNTCLMEVAEGAFRAGVLAESFAPDCVVVDFEIGHAEAEQICTSIRQDQKHSETVLIALMPDDGSPFAVAHLSINEVFQKPFDPELLSQRLKTYLGYEQSVLELQRPLLEPLPVNDG